MCIYVRIISVEPVVLEHVLQKFHKESSLIPVLVPRLPMGTNSLSFLGKSPKAPAKDSTLLAPEGKIYPTKGRNVWAL